MSPNSKLIVQVKKYSQFKDKMGYLNLLLYTKLNSMMHIGLIKKKCIKYSKAYLPPYQSLLPQQLHKNAGLKK